MRVLVTGSAGMLGSNLLEALSLNPAIEFKGLARKDADLRSRSEFESLLMQFQPDVVIHAAARVGGIQANISRPVEFLAANLQMDSNVITACLDNGVKNLVYLGSSCMYPKDYRQPLVESDLLMAPLEETNEGYALAKIAGSKLCEYATKSMGVNYKTIIPSNLYGPGDNFNPATSHLLASVVRKVLEAKRTGAKEIEVWGSGNARREFTYITDVTNWLAENLGEIENWPDRLNIGAGIDHSVNEFYTVAMAQLDVSAHLKHDLSKPEGMQAKLMDSTIARAKHNWNPITDLATGISATYEWFQSNQKDESSSWTTH
jgi:GDP-L-fucose synthase